MDHKVGQATGLRVFVRAGRFSRLAGSIFSSTPRSTVDCHSVSPPTANADLSLFRSNPTPKVQSLVGFEGAVRYSFQDLGNDFLSQSLAAASHVPRICYPAGIEVKGFVACASRYGVRQGRETREGEWGIIQSTRSGGGFDTLECWPWEYPVGKGALSR
jgi:hypothetical protein